MKLLLNVIWFVFGGLFLAIGYLFAALVMFILIITIPFGVQSLKLASYTLWPFGRALISTGKGGAANGIGNVIWFLLAGIWIAIGHVVSAAFCAITVVGIPLALAHLKIAKAALAPFGKEIVTIDQARQRGLATDVAVPA
jgi:uncharacterized membrane protein YccF (DUF307 family)